MTLQYSWLRLALFALAVLLAASVPLWGDGLSASTEPLAQKGDVVWPTEFEGRPLTPLGLTARESGFVKNFPGQIERFSDGQREIIIRHIIKPTRYLHPASVCLHASGYEIQALPMETNGNGQEMNCFIASPPERTSQTLKVCEWISGNKQHWSDVSSWYWSAIFAPQGAEWWSYAVAEHVEI